MEYPRVPCREGMNGTLSEGFAMTHAMWGIAIGVVLMVAASLYRYTQPRVSAPHARGVASQREWDSLREHYDL